MTASYEDTAKKTLFWLIGITAGVFALQQAFLGIADSRWIEDHFALERSNLLSGYLWTPITYAFLHDTSNPFHILFNMVILFFSGRIVLPILGQIRFLQLYFSAAVVGGIAWFLASYASGSTSVIGASAAVYSLVAFWGFLFWNREVEMLLFFVVPVRMKPKFLIYFFIGLSVLGLFFKELFNQGGAGVAHSAHLGGILTGWFFYKYIYAANPYDNAGTLSLSLTGWFKRKKTASKTSNYKYNVNISKPSSVDMQQEVDRILDKINSKGFGSLSPAEKKVLDEARDLLRKR